VTPDEIKIAGHNSTHVREDMRERFIVKEPERKRPFSRSRSGWNIVIKWIIKK